MVENKIPLCYSETVSKIQELIDDNINLSILDKRVYEKLKTLKHPQLVIEESYEKDVTSETIFLENIIKDSNLI